MRAAGAQGARGGATVELAITSVMFVSVLLVGIYFAEVGFLSLKVQEAASYAAMDATGRPVHEFRAALLTGDYDAAWKAHDSGNGYKAASKAAQNAYKDFDGVRNEGTVFTQVMTRASGMAVSCGKDDRLSFRVPNVSSSRNDMGAVRDRINDLYRDLGGVSCRASANVDAIRFPTTFMEKSNGSFAKEKLFESTSLKLCGIGRPSGNKCQGEYAVLTGDWSLDSAPDNEINNHSPQRRKIDASGSGLPEAEEQSGKQNPGYRRLVRNLYRANGDSKQAPGGGLTRAQRLVRIAGGYSVKEVMDNHNDRSFLMTFRGEEDDYGHMLNNTTDGENSTNTVYNTSGVFIPEWSDKKSRAKQLKLLRKRYSPCFLGLAREGCK